MDDMTRKFVRKDICRMHGHSIMGTFWVKVAKVAFKVCNYATDRGHYHCNKTISIAKVMLHDLSVDEAVAEV